MPKRAQRSRSSCHSSCNSGFLGPRIGAPNSEFAVSSAKSAVFILGPKLDAFLEPKNMLARVPFLDRHGNTTVEWQHGKIEKARDGSMRNVVGVLGTPEAMRLL